VSERTNKDIFWRNACIQKVLFTYDNYDNYNNDKL